MNNISAHPIEFINKNLIKVLVFDVFMKILNNFREGFKDEPSYYLTMVSTSYTALIMRDIFRDENINHPWLGGIIMGTIKYFVKDSYPLVGAFNNWAYEATTGWDIAKVGLQMPLIEGTEAIMVNCYKKFANDTDINNLYCISQGFSTGVMGGMTLIGFIPVYNLLANYEKFLPAFLTVPMACGLISYTAYEFYEKTGLENFTFDSFNMHTLVGSYLGDIELFSDITHDPEELL